MKTWTMAYSAATRKQIKDKALAEADEYRTGARVRRYESPKMIALHGRQPWPAEDAARNVYEAYLLGAAVAERHPAVHVELHYGRKLYR